MKKPKGALSTKARAKREVAWKLSYLRPIIGVGSKGKKDTNPYTPRDSELSNKYILSLSISNRGNPLFVSIIPFSSFIHPSSSIYIS
ncbi:hypothetical protein HKD37_04G010503 [Glycine soja]